MLISTKNPAKVDFQKASLQLLGDLKTQQEIISTEKIEMIAEDLARKINSQIKIKSNKKNLLDEVTEAGHELLNSYFLLTKEIENKNLSPASEWFLDNFHIIEEQIRSIKRDLPRHYYKELPKIKDGDDAGYPRVYIISQAIVSLGDARLDLLTIERFVHAFQKITPLTIGELWAVAITLRISLIKRLLPVVRRILISRNERIHADQFADELLNLAVQLEDPSGKITEKMDACFCDADRFSRPFIVQLIQRLRDQDPEIFKTTTWLEDVLSKCQTSTTELIQHEHYSQAADQVSVGNIITSMRLFSKIDWHVFFENVSLVDPILKMDPLNVYGQMDLATRDSYRKVIEKLSKRSSIQEIDISRIVLDVARIDHRHIGHYLHGKEVLKIEHKIAYRSPLKEKFFRLVEARPGLFYFGAIVFLILTFYYVVFHQAHGYFRQTWSLIGLFILMLIPMSELSIGIINYFITLFKKPRRLPKMDYKDSVPNELKTMVVVPCLFTSGETIKELVHHLEVQYLANQDQNIYFSLLGDFKDAETEIIESDREFLNLVEFEVAELNARYPAIGAPRFSVFYRKRTHNPAEGKWMGWERKRGKICEFNRLLRGDHTTNYVDNHWDLSFLAEIKYIITLDADTQLPLQTAKKLIATIAHPLNQPIYDKEKNIITKGFGIIQPRISVSLVSAAKTRFAQIFSGNTGIDPYTTAVSDVYQDMFGEGSFTGKGLYEVDFFEKVLNQRVPENTVLSHDLFEGSFTRVGLATDLELIDDYPSDFETFCKRLHRWTRGDWQLLPWLFPYVRNSLNVKIKNDLPLVARWKIFDNLRRSVLPPITLLWLLLSWFILPGPVILWTLGIIFSMSCPVFISTLKDLIKTRHIPWREHLRNNIYALKIRTEQVTMMVVYLPEVSFAALDAIFRVLYRMNVSKKHLLEWVTFSQLQDKRKEKRWKDLVTFGPVFGILVGISIFYLRRDSFLVALPFLFSWILTPYITLGTQSPIAPSTTPLGDVEKKKYRRYARLTWNFFETFAGPNDNWLAPDNFQEDPSSIIAHRTSPTNLGLQLLSNLSAFDFGFIGMHDFIERTESIFEALHKMEKLNGHFYNWYNTQTLEPLNPRYISTVDSGNLAGHLITLKQACIELSKGSFKSGQERIGLKDSFAILEDYLNDLQTQPFLPRSGSLKRMIISVQTISKDIENFSWNEILDLLQNIKKLFADLETDEKTTLFLKIDRWLNAVATQIQSYQKDETADLNRIRLSLKTIAYQAHDMAHDMDFKFLYDEQRKIFVIGHNVTDSKRDESYYDLLASESRLASFFAISKGDIPDEHWFRLGRQLTSTVGSRALISWSATMFEYLMPLLVMKRYEETLLDQTYESVVRRQIEYGLQRQTPWGISESGYNARDLQFNYQYGPFGIPGLGLKRGLRDELVVSPYSTMLAAMVFPREALKNLEDLEKMGVLGNYGFYESVDYTTERVPKNKKSIILRSYMAHHQGMSLLSLNNLLHQSILQKRFHTDARNQAIQLLLQERIPVVTEISKPRAEETHAEGFKRRSENDHTRVYKNPSLQNPRTQLISNGAYSLMVTSAGSGYSSYQGKLIYRWREDSTLDNLGQYFYIKNLKTGKIWSSGHQPTLTKAKKYEAIFAEDKIDLFREDEEVITNTEIIVSSEDNIELRRISLTNTSTEEVTLEVTSYMEVVLAKRGDDSAHPAFSKLFIQTEFLAGTKTLLGSRRPRSSNEKEIWGLHLLAVEGEMVGETEYESDRMSFIGRGRSLADAQAIFENQRLSKKTGAVLDPVFSLRQQVLIRPKSTVHLVFSTGVAQSRDEAIKLAEKYHDPGLFTRESNLGWVRSQMNLRHLNISMEKAHLYQRLGGHLIYLSPHLRAQSKIILTNRKQQSALWPYGISGDLPILLIRIFGDKDISIVRDLLHCHEYLRLKGFHFDLLILNEHKTSYLQTLHDEVMRQILMSGNHHLIDQPGGIFVRRSDQIQEDDLNLMKTIARVNLIAEKGTLEEQLGRRPLEKELPPFFVPLIPKRLHPQITLKTPPLIFYNQLGGFTTEGDEYVIHLREKLWTPAPWVNIIANSKNFGCMITESGLGQTWSINGRENRISPWSNDPVSDPVSEALYIRDEDTGSLWSPTPLPIRSSEDYIIRHGQGHTKFEHCSHGIYHHLTIFVPQDDSVKVMTLKMRNDSGRRRKLSLTAYIEWALGFSHYDSSATIISEWDGNLKAIIARNTYHNDFPERLAFLAINLPVTSFTCDRKEFLGRNGSTRLPEAMRRQILSGKEGAGLDPCGSLQTIFDMNDQEEKEIIILIGESSDREELKRILQSYTDAINVQNEFKKMTSFWSQTKKVLEISTPDQALNILVNKWLLYQTLSCRFWARSAFYQSGGAFGFRDQLQDVMAMVYSHPEITREHILLCASRQFIEGDVQHWWHPPSGRGVRTRFADDLLWLPFVISFYLKVTGDYSLLHETVPYIETNTLNEGEDEIYTWPKISGTQGSIYEHCIKVILRSLPVGKHGLPLFGSGDWNDGMNRVGHRGEGESVWMAWFLAATIKGFLPYCQTMNDQSNQKKLSDHLLLLKNSTFENAWDGEWYLRGFFDDGSTLGSHLDEECKIDSIAQSWSILSGFGDEERVKMAMEAVDLHLIDRDQKIIKLFTPPFDKSPKDPGYIKGYVPGVRENGGQYTHAAIWTSMAFAKIKDQRAYEIYHMLNPIQHTAGEDGVKTYKIEPYVIAADIYGVEPHIGRGGWSWYTGSASWMYRAAIESLLGFRLTKDNLTFDPCLPKEWKDVDITYQKNKTTYAIKLMNNQEDDYVFLDGVRQISRQVPIIDDEITHCVLFHIRPLDQKEKKDENISG
jgi:cellobiose phosphorylase